MFKIFGWIKNIFNFESKSRDKIESSIRGNGNKVSNSINSGSKNER